MSLRTLDDGANPRRRWIVPALALALFLVVGFAAVSLRRGTRRSPADAPGLAVTIEAPRGDIASAPGAFTWHPVAGATRYTVTISDADAVWPLFVRTTTDSSLALEKRETVALTPGRIHAWEVQALDASGRPIASGEARFRILRP